MSHESLLGSDTPLTLSLQRQINLRTGGRIRQLQVEAVGDRVTISGLASTYYAKQLAIQVVQEILGVDRESRVALLIEVVAVERPTVKRAVQPSRSEST